VLIIAAVIEDQGPRWLVYGRASARSDV